MEGDLALEGQARGQIGGMLPGLNEGVDQNYITNLGRLLDRETKKGFTQSHARLNQRQSKLGLGRSSFDAERKTMLHKAEGEQFGENLLVAKERGQGLATGKLNNKLNTLRTLMGLTGKGKAIGDSQLALDQQHDADKAAGWGAFGGSLGNLGTMLMLNKYGGGGTGNTQQKNYQ